jgi:hypothetical protein
MSAHRQLDLFPVVSRTARDVHVFLVAAARRPVHLRITRNRVSMASVRFAPDAVVLRLNEAFLSAPEAVLQHLGEYLRSRSPQAWRAVGDYARTLVPAVTPEAAIPLCTKGRTYDLAAIRDVVNERHFSGRLKCRITWGRMGRRPRRARTRTIRFGSYAKALDLIRINPLLDDPSVPLEFVEYIVFHEMLHAVVPGAAGGARPHHSGYRALERRYPGYDRLRTISAALTRRLAE